MVSVLLVNPVAVTVTVCEPSAMLANSACPLLPVVPDVEPMATVAPSIASVPSLIVNVNVLVVVVVSGLSSVAGGYLWVSV